MRVRGFTIIELIIIIVIIGILTVTAAPQLFGKSKFAHRGVQSQIIAQLRLAQLKALNDRSGCYALHINSNSIGIYQTTATADGCESTYTLYDSSAISDDVVVTIGGNSSSSNTLKVLLDGKGRPSGGNCSRGSQCVMNIVVDELAQVCFESEGYVHDC